LFLDATGRFMFRRLLLAVAGLCGTAGLIIEYGTYPTPWLLSAARVLSGAAVGLFLLEQALSMRDSGSFKRHLRKRWPTFLLSVLLILEMLTLLAGRQTTWLNSALGHLAVGSVTRAYLIIIQIYIVSVFAVQLPHLHQRFARLQVRPAVAFVVTFLALILLGVGLLLLPRATPSDQPLVPLDARSSSWVDWASCP